METKPGAAEGKAGDVSVNELPIIESCSGCGACCMEQESPPGYVMLIARPELSTGSFAKDANRLQHMPAAARAELDRHIADVMANPRHGAKQPCIWLDRETMQCRWYEHRPSICRDGLERGDESCRLWRVQYGKATADERQALLAAELREALGK